MVEAVSAKGSRVKDLHDLAWKILERSRFTDFNLRVIWAPCEYVRADIDASRQFPFEDPDRYLDDWDVWVSGFIRIIKRSGNPLTCYLFASAGL